MADPLDKYRQAILQTGFPLEFRVASAFEKHGWSVIQSKYYLDDVAPTAREIDLLAYRTTKRGSTLIYTTVIVSCKKDASHTWGFCAKKLPAQMRNRNKYPMHAWTNNKILAHMLELGDWKSKYLARAAKESFFEELLEPEVDVFAFQCLNRESGSAQNDKPMFDSVSSLIKAQSYELESMRKRGRSDLRLYSFNLLTVADAPFVRLLFEKDDIQTTSIDRECYISRHIVNQTESDIRVVFCGLPRLETALKSFNSLHVFNTAFFADQVEAFYADPFSDRRWASVYAAELAARVLWVIHMELEDAGEKATIDGLHWDKINNKLKIVVAGVDYSANEKLNHSRGLMRMTASVLKDLYKYTGPFEYEADIPF